MISVRRVPRSCKVRDEEECGTGHLGLSRGFRRIDSGMISLTCSPIVTDLSRYSSIFDAEYTVLTGPPRGRVLTG